MQMIENIHQRLILISKREGGIFSPKRKQGEHEKLPLGSTFQSVHFANGNPAKPLKTSRRKNFNRYNFHVFPTRFNRPKQGLLAFLATRHSSLATAFNALCYTPPRGDPPRQMPSEYVGELRKLGQEITRKGAPCQSDDVVRAADLIGKNFAVQPHEVAILGLATDERFLRFIVPENLRTVGQIPLSSTNSLAARTVREKRPEIINHFSVVPHASVFEAVPIPPELVRGEPIQKIMSMPVMIEKKVVGVIQVSRKGATAAEAGPDFTHPQLRELKTIADALAPSIPLCPQEFPTVEPPLE